MDMQKIAHILADAFVNSRMTFDELSEKTGIPKSALHRYMSGETEKIPIDRFEAICNALGLDAPAVLGWKTPSWDHTIHAWEEVPPTKPVFTPSKPSDSSKAKIMQAIAALAKTDKEAAVSLLSVLVDQGVI